MSKFKKIVALGKYVLVQQEEAHSKVESKSGLSIPQNTDKEQNAQGIVLDVGAAVSLKLKKGDFVLYGAYAGEVTEFEGQEFKFLHEDDFIGKLE